MLLKRRRINSSPYSIIHPREWMRNDLLTKRRGCPRILNDQHRSRITNSNDAENWLNRTIPIPPQKRRQSIIAKNNGQESDLPRMVEKKGGDYLKEDDWNQRALVTRVSWFYAMVKKNVIWSDGFFGNKFPRKTRKIKKSVLEDFVCWRGWW